MIDELLLVGLFCIVIFYAYNFLKKITADQDI